MNCINHNNLPAKGFCSSCGKPYCEDCLVNYGGEFRCRFCLSTIQKSENQFFEASPKPLEAKKGKNNQKSKTKNTGAGILTFILIFVIIAIIVPDVDSSNTKAPENTISSPVYESPEPEPVDDPLNGFTVNDMDFYVDKYTVYIIGKIVNNKSYTLSYMQVGFNLYDKNDNIIGTALDNIRNVGPGETWSFKAGIFTDDVENIKVTEIIGY